LRKLFGSKSKKKSPPVGNTDRELPHEDSVDSIEQEHHEYNADSIEQEQPLNTEGIAEQSQKKSGRKKSTPRRKQFIYGSLIVVGVFLATWALRTLISYSQEDADARFEYEQLRESFPEVAGEPTPIDDIDEIIEPEEEERDLRDLSLDELAALNRDFVGWINASSRIDYPVVRGSDNNKYINTTFLGARNTAGAIFMDYRHSKGFDEHVAILYGHYTRDGSMFTTLISFLDPGYRRTNPNINITTRDGRALTYKVFAAKLTDAWDIAYTVGINESSRASEVFPDAPANARRFLLLSTCTRSRNDDERILVFAALT